MLGCLVVATCLAGTLVHLTVKERLRRLVDRLSEQKAASVLVLLEDEDRVEDAESAQLPEFFGMLHSGKRDLAARPSEILSAEIGRH